MHAIIAQLPTATTAATTYSYQSLMVAVNNIVDFLMRVASLAVVVVIVWYGLKMAMAKGDEGAYSAARKGLTSALIGAVVIFGVWTIIFTIRYFVGTLTG